MITMLEFSIAHVFFSFIIFQLISNNKQKINIPFLLPTNDNFVIMSCACGEEFLFRIFPNLLFPDYYFIRYLISCVLFSLLHIMPYFSNKKTLSETIVVVYFTFMMGFLFSTLQSTMNNDILWYVVCCALHTCNNWYVIRSENKDVKFNVGNNGFVMKTL